MIAKIPCKIFLILLLNAGVSSQTQECSDTSGTCTIDGDDATCDGLSSDDTVSSCDTVTCKDQHSCEYATIQDSQTVKCAGLQSCYVSTITGVAELLECSDYNSCENAKISDVPNIECSWEASCIKAEISNVGNLKCSSWDSCQGADISKVHSGGSVDCGEATVSNYFSCQDVTITSEDPFTLACLGPVDVDDLFVCGRSASDKNDLVTNPGGSVFCHGGSSANGICDMMLISDSVGCLICGNSEACRDVELVDDSGDVTETIPNGQVYVQSTCTTDQVLSYLNKVHPEDGDTACEDSDGDGYCDVLNAYCFNNPCDANCVEEFQLSGGEWVKEETSDTCAEVSGTCTIDGDDATCDGLSSENTVCNCNTVTCKDQQSCEYATIQDSQTVKCAGLQSCYVSTITGVAELLECSDYNSCENAKISDVPNIECSWEASCIKAEISNVGNLKCSSWDSCQGADISNVHSGGSVDCGAATVSNYFSCQDVTITSEDPFTLTCLGPVDVDDLFVCGRSASDKDNHVSNPGGSVFCHGGSSANGICDMMLISDSVGCLICGNSEACRDVELVDDSGDVTETIPNGQVYVQSTCTTDQVLSYLNKVHPEDGDTACQKNDGSEYCSVVDAYCENNSEDANCADEFQYNSEGSWTKNGICGVSPEGGNCVVDSDDVSCTGWDTSSYTVGSCGDITCTEKYSCYMNTFTDSESLECNGNEACDSVTISSVTNVVCSGGDSACEYATISDVPEDGYVDCGDPEEAYNYICRDATITSENAFTLTCAGTPGESILACAEGHIENPGGSVFCYGGTSGNGVCHDLTINESVQCVLCASDDACENVKIVNDNGDEVDSIRDHKLSVSESCEASDIVDFLNKVHPEGGSVSCQVDDGSGDCDVVEKYCARKTRDANCVKEFQVVDGIWTKEKIRSTNAIDPESRASDSNDDNNDKVSRETWLVFSVVILILLVVMISVVLYYKNCWNYCTKCLCGLEHHTKSEEVESEHVPKEEKDRGTPQNNFGKDEEQDANDIQQT